MKKYKYLVTGHKGFIGSHLFESLVGPKLGIDLKDGQDVIDCLPDDIEVDTVFHLAALPKVEYSVENPCYTLKHNVYATSVLLNWCRSHGVKRFVFSSSAATTGDGQGPTSPYGLHKLMSEMECKLYSQLYGLDTVCLRYFNVYSEDQPFGGSYSTVISAWMEMVRQDRPLRIDGDGEQTRDYIHVDDVVSANLFCASHNKNFNGAVYDVGSGDVVSLNNIKEFVNENLKVSWDHAPVRPGDVRHTEADTSKLRKLGWTAKIGILEGLTRCFK